MRAARVLFALVATVALLVMAGASVVGAQASRRRACYERHIAYQGYFGNIEAYRPYLETLTKGQPTPADQSNSEKIAEQVWPGGC